jgi:hypothetical protein
VAELPSHPQFPIECRVSAYQIGRRTEGSEENPQTWVDFLAPPGRPLRYRVAAINPEDTDEAASAATNPITL